MSAWPSGHDWDLTTARCVRCGGAAVDIAREERDGLASQCPSSSVLEFPRDHVPLSVRTGGRRKRANWWLKGKRERLAYRLAPWLKTR